MVIGTVLPRIENPAKFLHAHGITYLALLRELSEVKKAGDKQDTGYCEIDGHMLTVKDSTTLEVCYFSSIQALHAHVIQAYIL